MSDFETFTICRKQESMERRASHRQTSPAILIQKGVSFESKNDGAHLIVTHDAKVYDFWPGTGKFIPRDGSKQGRGVFNLLKRMGIKP